MVRFLSIVIASMGVAAWLFGDTYAKYFGNTPHSDTIRFAHFGPYEDYVLWQGVIADFERSHPGVRVRQEYVVGPGGHYNTKMRQQVLTNTLPDVALVQSAPFHELAGAFADLGDLLEEFNDEQPGGTLTPSAVATFQHGGVQRGLPICGGNLMIYVNRNCVAAAERHHGRPLEWPGGDWTMEQFREFAKELTCDFDGDGRLDQFGFWLPPWVYYQPFLWSFGAELTDPKQEQWTLCGPAAEQALAFYRALLVADRVAPREEDVPQVFQDVGFLTGRAAMCVNGPWLQPFLAGTNLKDSFDVLPIPRGPAGQLTRMTWDGVVLAPSTTPDRHSLARKFVRHLLSEGVQRRLADTGRALPARKSAWSALAADRSAKQRGAFADAVPASRVQPVLPNFGDIDSAMNQLLYRVAHPTSNVDVGDELRRIAEDPRISGAFPRRSPCLP